MTDRELLEWAAKAAGMEIEWLSSGVCWLPNPAFERWDPLDNDGDRYRLAKQLGISIDFVDCCAWKRFPNGDLIQEFWGGDYGDEAHAIVRVAAETGRGM